VGVWTGRTLGDAESSWMVVPARRLEASMRCACLVYSKGGVRVRGFPRHARRGSPSILSLWVLGLALTSIASAERVGWWKMDEGSGAIAFDSSGCGNVLSLKGDPRWVAGHV